MAVFALILSGGAGNRFGNDLPKQFAEVFGKTILDYCISRFQKNDMVDYLIVVGNSDHFQRTCQIATKSKFSKIISVIEGGKTRGESSYIGISEAVRLSSDPENDIILIQDAVRPNTSDKIISSAINSLKTFDAVSVAVQSTDTVYIVDDDKNINQIPKRSYVFNAQTPQGFKLKTIFEAYNIMEKVRRFSFTDDCGLLNCVNPNIKIQIIEGENSNLKITFSEDLEIFREFLLKKNRRTKRNYFITNNFLQTEQ